MRIIMFTGKGGVGKTSIASATGIQSAKRGYRTLVMSLDSAHSLADSFDLDRRLMDRAKGKPVDVADNLAIQEVDVQEEVQEHWGEVHSYISCLLNVSGLEEVLAEELAILPGMEEVTSLLNINRYLKDDAYDVILLDCAPTGESLRFISLPTTLEWYMKKIFTVERAMFKVTRPVMKQLTSVPLPEDSYFQSLAVLYERLEGIDKLLTDADTTTVRLVTNPEKMVIKESQRAFMYFSLYGLCVDAVVINRVLPEEVGGYFDKWLEAQKKYIEDVHNCFSPVPTWQVELSRNEMIGIDDLARLGEDLYGDRDPTERFYAKNPLTFRKRNGKYVMTLQTPFITKEDIDLSKSGGELIVRIGNYKRHVLLPRSMAGREPSGAKLDGDKLTVTFGGKNG
ncbi:MAG: TRC40/GET3/ArsA family transport-energizing ATPase [Planctomycetes bacterium]|nr:TRC40/GET3/ArsA family transport-energizing ATPase [Planctomycetota bacterium]